MWPWALAFAPALVLLLLILPLRVSMPYFDSWAFVRQYRDWMNGDYSWSRFFYKHGDHPSIMGKLVYFATLHWFRGNVGLLPLFHWGITAVTSVGVMVMTRPLWAGNRLLGLLLMICANLTIFSAARGGIWLWDSTYQNFIPGPCLAVGLVVLFTGRLTTWRVLVAALANAIATFSFATGFLVGILCSLLIWDGMADRSFRQRWLAVGGWLALTAVVALVAFKSPAPDHESLNLMNLFDRPLMRFQFLLILLGQMLGKGTAFEPFTLGTFMGGALVLVFAVCTAFVFLHRRNRELVTASLPWFACGLFGLINATLVSIGRMGNSPDSFKAFSHFNALGDRWMSERFMLTTQFFVFGVVLLAAAVMRFGGNDGWISRWMKKTAGPLLTVFIGAHLVNWEVGWQHMKMENILLKQEQAMLSFGSIMPLDPDRLWNARTKGQTYELAKYLVDRGLLPSVKIVPDDRLTSFQLAEEIPQRKGWFNKPVQLENGQWKVGGACGALGQDISSLPNLILITVEPAGGAERVVAIAAPWLPENFFERQSMRIKYPAHYYGWSQVLDPASIPAGKTILRSYAFEQKPNRIHLISGIHEVEVPAKPAQAPQ